MGIKQFQETVELLNTLADKFHVRFQDLTKVPDYAAFVRSPQYKEWLKSRRQPRGAGASLRAQRSGPS